MLTPDLLKEIDEFVDALKKAFASPEFIPGCEVTSVADINEYATNNGWVEAVVGQHNNQRCRWISNEAVAVGSFVDVVYFADRRIFHVFSLGGSSSPGASPHQRGVWLYDVSTSYKVKYTTITAALAAAASGDIVEWDGTFTEAVTIPAGVTLRGVSRQGSIITNATNDGTTITIGGAGAAIENCTINQTAAGGSFFSTCITSEEDDLIVRNCNINKTGACADGRALYIYGGSADVEYCNISANNATASYAFRNDTADVVVTFRETVLTGNTWDLFSNRSGTFVTMFDSVPFNDLISFSGTLQGKAKTSQGKDLFLYPYPNGFGGQATNYVINTSVASNDLTVALKTLLGSDPSFSDRISARIGDNVYDITAALSVTALDGTNWCNLGAAETATQDVDLFCYLIAETGAAAGVKIGFSRVPYARQMGDFTNTTTSERYIKGNWTNFNSTDKVEVIGRFNATLSAGAGYTWTIPATSIIVNRPIFETRWLTYTPTVTSQSGTITTVGTVAGAYKINFNELFFNHLATITTNGTGAGAVRLTLPFTPSTDNAICAGRENAVTGLMLQGRAASNFMEYLRYDNVYPGGDGRVIKGGGISLRLI